MGAYLRRMKVSLGAPNAITATARKVAVMIDRALKYGLEDVDPGQTRCEQQYHDRLLQPLTRQTRELGYQLIPTPPTPTASNSMTHQHTSQPNPP